MPDHNSNEQRTAIITGASEGIGHALALHLARHRDYALLVLAARSLEPLEALCAQCREAGVDAIAVATDVSRASDCERLIDAAVARSGRIDTLFNNAGITMWTNFDEVEDLALFARIMDVNYLGAVYCTAYALAHLKATRGRIVSVASVAGLTGVPTRSGYSASKHAMLGFFDSLRIELAGSGVSVTNIAPDFVVSQIHKRALGSDGKALGKSPMREDKIMTAAQCAALIARAAERRQRLLITSLRGRAGRWLKLIAPGLIDRIALRAIRRGA